MRESAKRFTWIWTIMAAILGLFAVSVMLSSRPGSGRLSDRAVSSANLRGIGQAMHIYAEDNNEWFPIAVHAAPPGDETQSEDRPADEATP